MHIIFVVKVKILNLRRT